MLGKHTNLILNCFILFLALQFTYSLSTPSPLLTIFNLFKIYIHLEIGPFASKYKLLDLIEDSRPTIWFFNATKRRFELQDLYKLDQFYSNCTKVFLCIVSTNYIAVILLSPYLKLRYKPYFHTLAYLSAFFHII